MRKEGKKGQEAENAAELFIHHLSGKNTQTELGAPFLESTASSSKGCHSCVTLHIQSLKQRQGLIRIS